MGEGVLVRLRRLREAAHLAHVLLRGEAHLVRGRNRLEVVERLDVPAHADINTMTPRNASSVRRHWTVPYSTPSSRSSSSTSASSSSQTRYRRELACRSPPCRSCSRRCTNAWEVAH